MSCHWPQAVKAVVEGLQNDVQDKRLKPRVHVMYGFSGVGKSTILDGQCRLWPDDSEYRHLPEGSHSTTQVSHVFISYSLKSRLVMSVCK